MSHNSKIITMFAVLITTYRSNAGCQLAFKVQAFFMPGHIVYHIWYPCTPVWSVNAPTAFDRCDKQRERHGYFHFKNVLLCLTIQKFPKLRSTALERPLTKRVLLLSPLPAILTPTLPLTALTSTDVPSATYVQPIRTAISLPGDSTSPDVKRLQELLATKLSLSSWLKSIRNISVMRQSAVSVSVNANMPYGYHVIKRWRSITATSLSCSLLTIQQGIATSCMVCHWCRLCKIFTP